MLCADDDIWGGGVVHVSKRFKKKKFEKMSSMIFLHICTTQMKCEEQTEKFSSVSFKLILTNSLSKRETIFSNEKLV